MAAAVAERGFGRVTTVDMYAHQPINVTVLAKHAGLSDYLDVVVEPLGYNWYLADLLAASDPPSFDLCLLDGAHEWEPDALAVFLVTSLLQPGSWLVLDDLNFSLSQLGERASHQHLTPRELTTCQMSMVFDLVVARHSAYSDYQVTAGGRVGWARKKTSPLQRARLAWHSLLKSRRPV